MNVKTVIERLRANRERLSSQGILHASVFGSVARGESSLASDIDIAVELDPVARIGGFAFAGLQIELSDILGHEVDLVALPARNKRLGAEIERDGVVAF
jgi:predicted nucleotidyltransferase